MTRWRLVAAVLVASVLASCGGDDGDGARGASRAGAGWSELGRPPIEPRGLPVIEWTGSELVVFGGALLGGGPEATFAADGAIFDPAEDRWRAVPAPAVGPLADPTGAWTGTELVVMGTRCDGGLGHDEDASSCDPGTLRMATLDPETDRWRSVPLAEELVRAQEQGTPHIRGAVAGEVLVSAGRSDGFLVDPASGDARTVPEPPFEADGICADDDGLVALDYEYDDPQDPSGDQTPPTATLSASVLRPTGERPAWSPVERLPAPDGGAEFTSHVCGGGGALVLNQLVDRRQVVVRFDGTGWSTVPPPPVWLGVSAPSAWTGEEWLVWTNDPLQPEQLPTIVAFRPSTGAWSTVPGTMLPSEVVAAGDAVVQYTFGSGRMSLEVVER